MYLAKEPDLEYLNRSGDGRQFMSGWHDVEIFDLPPSARFKSSVPIL